MIKMLRLDNRLIHGQVATQWIKALDIDSIIVVDDNSASSPMLTKALMMAVPKNLKTVVKSCKDALAILTDPRCKSKKVFVVTGRLEYLNEITKACKDDIETLVVGNFGNINPEGIKRDTYGESLYLSTEEHKLLKGIATSGIKCYYWTVPAKEKVSLEKVLK